jgi:oxaloacetate decarboxylase gamma subunit
MEINLVAEGLKFMVLGMGVVFLFLTLLVQIMKGQAYLIARWIPPSPEPTVPDEAGSTDTDTQESAARVAAIIAAVEAFRRDQAAGRI